MNRKWIQILRITLIIVYVAFVLHTTLFRRVPMSTPIFKGLFWEISQGYWHDILLNILLFLPVGLFVGKWRGVVYGFCMSIFIEICQYYFLLGFCELDDVLNNTIGSLIGVLITKGIQRLVKRQEGAS